MQAVKSPFPQFFDTIGGPLENGSIYFGQPNLDPVQNPIIVYWDLAGTQAAAQPVKTINGVPARDGAAANVYVNQDYSIIVFDKKGVFIFSRPTSLDATAIDTVMQQSSRQASNTGNDNATLNDGLIYWNTNISGTKTQFVPAANTAPPNFRLSIKDLLGDSAINNIVITPNSGNVDNFPTYTINRAFASITLAADPANNRWVIV